MLNQSIYTLCVDALALMVNQPVGTPYDLNLFNQAPADCISNGATRLTLINNTGRNFYRYAYEIEINGKPYGTLHLQSLRGESALMKVTIFNRNLYTDFITPFKQFQQDFNLRINNVSKLDVAADTNKNIIMWFLNYFDMPDLYEYRVSQRQRESILTFAKEYRNGIINKALYPYRVEGKSLRIYNKSQELRDNGNEKYYIKDYQRANGLDTGTDIYRTEISLTNSVLKTQDTVYQDKNTKEVITEYKYNKLTDTAKRYYEPLTETSDAIDFYQLFDSEYLASIFNRYAGKLIEFRMYDNDNVTRRTRIALLELNNPRPLVPLTSLNLPGKYQQRNNLNAIKVLVQQSFTLNLPALLASAYALAEQSGISERIAKFIELYKPKTSLPLNTVSANFNGLPSTVEELAAQQSTAPVASSKENDWLDF